MHKNIKILIITIFISIFTIGCGYEMNATVSPTTANVDYNFYLSSAEEKSILSDINKKSKTKYKSFTEFANSLGLTQNGNKKISNKNHNRYSISTTYDSSEFDNIFIHFDNKYATISADDISKKVAENYKSYVNIKNTKLNYCTFNIKYPYKVFKANGKIKKDGYTVTYTLSKKKSYDKRFWAIFNKKVNTTASIKGIPKRTTYSKKTTTVYPSTIVTSFTVNNIEQYTDTYKIDKDGIYYIKIVNINGKKSTRTLIYDKTSPVVTGIKNGATYKKSARIKFYDKTSGIKSAKLNNVSIKSNKLITKKGRYTLKVTDYAGNVKIVKFTIK